MDYISSPDTILYYIVCYSFMIITRDISERRAAPIHRQSHGRRTTGKESLTDHWRCVHITLAMLWAILTPIITLCVYQKAPNLAYHEPYPRDAWEGRASLPEQRYASAYPRYRREDVVPSVRADFRLGVWRNGQVVALHRPTRLVRSPPHRNSPGSWRSTVRGSDPTVNGFGGG